MKRFAIVSFTFLLQQLRQLCDVDRNPPRLILREVLHIDPAEAGGRRAESVMTRRDTCRDVSRIAAQGEVARIAGHRDLTRSRGQQGSPPLEPDNLAHKMRGETQLFRQICR